MFCIGIGAFQIILLVVTVLADLLRRAGDGASARESRFLFFGEAGQQLLNLRDGAARVEALGTGFSAVHDGVAAEHGEGVPQPVQSLLVLAVPAVYDPPVGLHQHSRAQVAVTVPPVAGAGRAAAGAEDALVQTVKLGAVSGTLQQLF